MTAEVAGTAAMGGRAAGGARSEARLLRRLAVTLGLGWSALFVLVGVGFRLQLYGDGSIFSYSVAVRDGWALPLPQHRRPDVRLCVLALCRPKPMWR